LHKPPIEPDILEKARSWIQQYGEEFFLELVAIYLEDTPKGLLELRQALEVRDAPTITRAAHTLKSSSANLGAMRMSAIAREIESAGGVAEFGQLNEQVARSEAEFAIVKAALELLSCTPQKIVANET
jgi:HPt (histidine-containing phosphotransfer) domain-containing protein